MRKSSKFLAKILPTGNEIFHNFPKITLQAENREGRCEKRLRFIVGTALCCGVFRILRISNDVRLEFAGEVEADFGEVALCHLEHIARVGKENVASLAVESHKLVLAALEGFECLGIVALYPACLVEVNGFPAALCAILM